MKTQNGEEGRGFFSSKLVIPFWFVVLFCLLFVLGVFLPFAPKLLVIPMRIISVVLGVYSFYLLLFVVPDLAEKDRVMLEEIKQKKPEELKQKDEEPGDSCADQDGEVDPYYDSVDPATRNR